MVGWIFLRHHLNYTQNERFYMKFIEKIREKQLYSAISIALIGLMYGGFALVYASLSSKEPVALFLSYLHIPSLILLNIIPPVVFAFVFWLIFGRVWASALATGVAVVVPSCVGYLKILLRGDPFVAKDIFLASEAVKMSGEYVDFFRFPIIFAILLIVATSLICFFVFKTKLAHGRMRYGILLALILGFFGMYQLVYKNVGIYSSTENIERNSWYMSVWSEADQFSSRGFIYPFIWSVQNIVDKEPDGYDEDEVRALLESLGEGSIPDDNEINVIGIMLEAFADFSKFDFEVQNDPYENWHKLQADSYSGSLITNVFAGGTVDSERAFLTGQSQLIDYRSDADSYVRFFADEGYTVEGGHPCYGWFYNRQNVNFYLGFEDYWFYETRYNDPQMGDFGGLMTDTEFFIDLLGMYDANLETGKPYFNFSVTYQNHGPYDTDIQVFEEEFVAMTDTMTDEGYNIINNYLDGIKNTDQALGFLVDELEAKAEPIVLVLYGDHKPWLGNNSFVYDELGIDISLVDEQSYKNYYETNYIIWANSAAREALDKDFVEEGDAISPCYLMNKVFELCDFEEPAYMQLSNELFETVPIITNVGAWWVNGEFTTELTDDVRSEILEFRKYEYFRRHNLS